VLSGNELVFISGEVSPQAKELQVPAGAHRIEWRYLKDPYADVGEDTGFLHSLQWHPDPAAPYPVYGAYAFPGTYWHGSEWFGVWDTQYWPWVAHFDLGWMYFAGTPDGRLYGYSVLPQLGHFYTTPALFPFLYLTDTATGVYYYEGTGSYGRKAWFWNGNTNTYFQIP
ncbi:MAG TPA: hypothetical protein VK995_07075, partial [Oceanipulchritudo sp.]|nr:hypothetical protein [Oceanipulchritudo sp.]